MNIKAKEQECARLVKAAKIKQARDRLTKSISDWHWYDFRKWWYQPKGAPYLDTRSIAESKPSLHRLVFQVTLWIIMTPISFVFYYLGKAFTIMTNYAYLVWMKLKPIKTQHSSDRSLIHLWGLYSAEIRGMGSEETQLLMDWIAVLYGERGASINLQQIEYEFSDMVITANQDYYAGKNQTHVYFGNPTDHLVHIVSNELGTYL